MNYFCFFINVKRVILYSTSIYFQRFWYCNCWCFHGYAKLEDNDMVVYRNIVSILRWNWGFAKCAQSILAGDFGLETWFELSVFSMLVSGLITDCKRREIGEDGLWNGADGQIYGAFQSSFIHMKVSHFWLQAYQHIQFCRAAVVHLRTTKSRVICLLH